MRVSVTYDLTTEASATDGDHADHGYIDARTERRRSYARGRKRDIQRNHRMASDGKFNFPSLREALAFIDKQCCSHHETCWTGPLGAAGESALRVYSTDAYQDCNAEYVDGSLVVSIGYCLHIDACTAGTADRIARMLAANGVYFANRRDLQRKRTA